MISLRKRLHALALVVLMGLSAALPSCDVAAPSDFELPLVSFRFTFEAAPNTLQAGTTTSLTSIQQLDAVRIAVEAAGFTMADVISVRITSRVRGPEIELLRPLTGTVAHLSSVEVRGLQGGTPSAVILSRSGFPAAGNRAALNVQTADLTALALGGPFRARLDVTPSSQVVPGQIYEFDVTFDVAITVEA